MLEAEPDIPLTADPFSDMLTRWMNTSMEKSDNSQWGSLDTMLKAKVEADAISHSAAVLAYERRQDMSLSHPPRRSCFRDSCLLHGP